MTYRGILLALALLLVPLAARAISANWTAATTATVGTTSGTLVPAGTYSVFLQICTLPGSSSNVWLNPTGGSATTSSGVPVFSNGGCTYFGAPVLPLPSAAITAITDSGSSQTVTLSGG